jgi:ribose transport system permease protein
MTLENPLTGGTEAPLAPSEQGPSHGTAARAPNSQRRDWLQRRLGPLGVPAITVIIIAVFALLSPDFLKSGNFQAILSQCALPLIVAVGLTIPVVMGDFDLSIAAVSSFGTTVVAVMIARNDVPLVVGCALIVLIGIGVGIFNGVLVSVVGLSALVVTIAVGSVLNGLEFAIAGPVQIGSGFPEGFVNFARGQIGPIPTLFVLAIAIAVVVWVLLERTATGRNIRGIGGNMEAVRIAGVNVTRTRILGFVICSGLAAVSGVLYAGQQAVAYPLSGLNVLLPSFAAVFIGAAAFKLGEFNIPGTVIGILSASIINNGLLLLSVPSWAVYVFQGAILLIALLFARAVASSGPGRAS